MAELPVNFTSDTVELPVNSTFSSAQLPVNVFEWRKPRDDATRPSNQPLSDPPSSDSTSFDLQTVDRIFGHNNTSRQQAQPGGSSSSPGDTSAADSATESSVSAWEKSNSLVRHRRHREIASKDWKAAKMKMENLLRPAVLRYGKLNDESLHRILYEVLGAETDTSSLFFRKGLIKLRRNVAIWKCKTLFEIEKYVKKAMELDVMGQLRKEKDPQLLFTAFEGRYDFHDAEIAFSWAAKAIKFSGTSRRTTTSGGRCTGAGWIKTYFVNLAVEMKLLVSYGTECLTGEHRTRQHILDYYDAFPNLPQFRGMGTDIFETRPVKSVREPKTKEASKIVIHGDCRGLEYIAEDTESN